MRIIVDVLGGDNSPNAVILGAVNALEAADDFSIILSGDEWTIKEQLQVIGYVGDRITVLHAPEEISCNESPTVAIKRKKESSLVKALRAVADGEADAIVSAGSTGAVLAGATLIVKRIKGILRPGLAPILPSEKGPFMLIDCGANVDCKPEYLQQFAIMGSAYMSKVMGIENPRVGLINNGVESKKGNELTKATYSILEETPGINFVGNAEAREIMTGAFDVLVCDGFVGNVVLKYTEGLAMSLVNMLKVELMGDTRSKLGAAISKPAYRRFKKRMDYTEYGGAPLLGINGGIIKAHGSSDAKAIKMAILQAREYLVGNVTETISTYLADAAVSIDKDN
ncbi:MAG: phosphate acyltransferase PlsX [Eubacteriales bacterium]|nr:phosphate acyltransferase PlsX [Eubacteriales bacterium]